MAATLTNIRTGQLDPVSLMPTATGAPMIMLAADLVFDAIYATGGELLSPTLDKYFSDITQVFLTGNSGINLEFVDNDDESLAKVKAYQAEGSHTHTLGITGGGAYASTIPVVYATDDDRLEKSKEVVHRGTQTGQASYTTGGQTLDLSSVFSGIPQVACDVQAIVNMAARYVPGTNASDGKIALLVPSTGAEVANTTNVSAQTVQYIAKGEVTNTGNVDVATEAAAGNTADEIASGQDISSITFGIFVVGKPKVSA